MPADAFTHVVASRNGLYFVSRGRYRKVADGLFFGVTVQSGTLYCFEAGGRPKHRTRRGRIVRFEMDGESVGAAEVVVDGLDNGCHQIDFFHGHLFVIDTYNQQVLEYDDRGRLAAEHTPIPRARHDERVTAYAHMNSFLGRDESILLLLHNGSSGKPSEIVEVDRQFREQGRRSLPDPGCHDIVILEHGELLVCNSQRGTLVSGDQTVVTIDRLLSRGLSVGTSEIAVGSSLFGARPVRNLVPGFVTFFDRAYQRLARLHLPAAPTQIRRLDAMDLSLSQPR